MAGGEAAGVDLSRKFVSESELDEKRKKRQEEWEKVRKPDDPEEVPEEEYDPRCLYDRLQEQKEKKQQEFEEQFKFRNMVRGLDEDESSFLDEVSRQQVLVEKQRRDEEKQELLEYRSALVKQASASAESRRESEKKAGPKQTGAEPKTSHLSQAHLLVGAVKRRSSSQSSDGSKKPRVENTRGIGDRLAEQDGGSREAEDRRAVPGLTAKTPPSAAHGMLHLPSAAVCVGVLPGLCAYSGSSDSDSSSDSEGSVDAIMSPYPRHNRAYR
ncbi:PSME3-interacting protein isoform X2 [Gambusia affinis]|uniref:PSME3-interacting protein isoform X2 n=1 Tax=Gambusia affinis TaxID=33528 RepID=UPI001CDD24F0|nr:PSME3-interacting protein isoform X2 [Gambusia affinis]